MNEMRKGYIVSAALHLFILAPLFLPALIASETDRPEPLDIGFSFRVKPLGNSLERPKSRPSDMPPPPRREESKTDSSTGENRPQAPTEQRYGASDGSEGVDEFYIAENFRSIMAIISNSMLYPAVARENGWQGKVLVSFVITTDGQITDIRLKQSSGYAILDNSAIRTIQSVRGVPAPSRPTRITVPIAFRMN